MAPAKSVRVEVREESGEPSWNRTLDPLIKSETRDLRTAMHDELSPRDSEGW